MNAIVAKQKLWRNKDFVTGLLLNKVWASRHTKCISPPYSSIQYQTCISQNLCHSSHIYNIKSKIYDSLCVRMQTMTSYICSTPELSERNFCNGLKMTLISPLGGIHHAGIPEIGAKALLLVFTCD